MPSMWENVRGIVNGLEERVGQLTRELAIANEALRESERNSRLVIDSIPGLVALLTAAGELEFVNHQVLEYTGRTLDELKQWGTNNTVHPEDLPQVIQIFTQAIGSGNPYEIVQRVRRSDGAYRWFQNNGFPLRNTSGHIVRWCVLLTDIDERKRAEDALRANELNFQLTVDTIPGMVHTMTATGGVEFVNHQILEYFGKTLEELSHWDLLVHPDDRARIVDLWTRSVASGEPYDAEHRVLRPDGTYRWMHSRGLPLRDTTGKIVRWYNLLTDIDERKRAEEALRASEHSLKLIIDTIPALAWSARPDGSVEFFNQHYLDFIGLSAEQARGWGWTAAVHPEDLNSLTATWQQIITSQLPGDTEARLRRHDGVYRWFLLRTNPLRDESGVIVKWYGVNTDIEDRKQSEVDLQRAYDNFANAEEALNRARSELAHVARVTTLSTLTASITHEINQPLTGIITNAGTCLRMLDADPPNLEGARETAKRTIRDGNRASDVIARLRALFSKKEFSLEPLDLNEVTRGVIALSVSELQRNRVMLQSEFGDDLPPVTGDRIQLQQVILNLLRNAADAMVDVHDRPRQLLIRTEREDADRVRVSVRDAGVGIDAQSMHRMFDAFYTTKREGMGIGLSVSRSIIDRHHGRLWAAPNDGPGATFAFSIPCDPPRVTEAASAKKRS